MKHTFKIIYHSASFKSATRAHMHVVFTSGCCLTVLCIRVAVAVVRIHLLPHWTVAVSLRGNEKPNLPLNSRKTLKKEMTGMMFVLIYVG